MSDTYIVIGASKGYIAGHASTIDTLVRAYKDGRTKSHTYKPASNNPGQETLQYIDSSHSEAEAVITKELQGPINYSGRAIINVGEDSIDKVIKNYKNGEYDSEISDATKRKGDASYDTPKQDGSGKGERDNEGRNPDCGPDDYKPTGKGSGTEKGRAKKGNSKYQTKLGGKSSGKSSLDSNSSKSSKS
jgi:hypothetical protein